MAKERSAYLDVLKAITIILVVFGHSIQYGSGIDYLVGGYCLYDPVFSFIYSFHMPLFMLISGYLFSHSSRGKTLKELIISRIKQIVFPLFSWSFISLLVYVIKIAVGASTQKISIVWIFQTILASFWGGPWFLWAIFWSSLFVMIGRSIFKDSPIFYLLVSLVGLVIPDYGNSAVHKFMLPFFFIAYLFGTLDLENKLKAIYTHKAFALSSVILFVLLLPGFGFDTFIYTTGYSLIGKNALYQLHSDSFRFVIGLVGSIAVMCVVHAFMDIIPRVIKRALTYVGTATLGIYLVSNYLFDEALKYLPIDGLNYWRAILEACVVLIISLLLNFVIRRFRITNVLFLGAR